MGTSLEIGPQPRLDQQTSHSQNAAHVPAAQVPTPDGNNVTSANPGFAGFNGLSHRDQRLAGTGRYTNTQFSLEPPDQGLCVGNGFVVEGVNNALQVFTTSGVTATAPAAFSQFWNLNPEVTRSNPPVYGDFISDPKCYYDATTGRFFLTELQISTDPATGAFMAPSHVLIAVSTTNDPTGMWNRYSIDTTDNGSNGTPANAGCPCFGDQPLIGADANGFYVTTNEFSLATSQFNGAQVYALSKSALEAGTLPPVVHIGNLPLAEGAAYSIQPATVPGGGSFETANGGTEYFLSALDFNATRDNRIAIWALANTRSLNSPEPNVSLTNAVIGSEVYGQPPDAQQRPGPTPLADSLKDHLELIAGNDDRMNQVVFAGGKLWSGVNTVVKTQNGPTRVGIAYFIVTPSSASGQAAGTIANQGYVAVNQENVMYPSIGVNAAGKGVMAFTLVGPDYYPSAAYAPIDAINGVGAVHIAGAGSGPDDGFTGYRVYGGNGTGRWGDYSAAVADSDGSIWTAAEYIPNAPRTILANWVPSSATSLRRVIESHAVPGHRPDEAQLSELHRVCGLLLTESSTCGGLDSDVPDRSPSMPGRCRPLMAAHGTLSSRPRRHQVAATRMPAAALSIS